MPPRLSTEIGSRARTHARVVTLVQCRHLLVVLHIINSSGGCMTQFTLTLYISHLQQLVNYSLIIPQGYLKMRPFLQSVGVHSLPNFFCFGNNFFFNLYILQRITGYSSDVVGTALVNTLSYDYDDTQGALLNEILSELASSLVAYNVFNFICSFFFPVKINETKEY